MCVILCEVVNCILSDACTYFLGWFKFPVILVFDESNGESILLGIERDVATTWKLCTEEVIDSRSWFEDDKLSFNGVDIGVVEEFA